MLNLERGLLITPCKHTLASITTPTLNGDDMIILVDDDTTIDQLKNFLNKSYHMEDLGLLIYYLGIGTQV